MIMQKFVNRKDELSKLKEAFDRNSLIVVYGRRRVGKTRLLVEAVRDRPHVYHLCKEEEVSETLKALSIKLFRLTGNEEFIRKPLFSFEEFFEALPPGTVLILDEFQVLVRNYPRILGILQEYLDFHAKTPP